MSLPFRAFSEYFNVNFLVSSQAKPLMENENNELYSEVLGALLILIIDFMCRSGPVILLFDCGLYIDQHSWKLFLTISNLLNSSQSSPGKSEKILSIGAMLNPQR